MTQSNVSPSAATWLRLPTKKVPIIVVPGIMGSRLADPKTHAEVWNPCVWNGRSPGSQATNAARLKDLSPLAADEWNTVGYPPDRAERAKLVKHFYGPIVDYYDDLCFALCEDLVLRLLKTDYSPSVYAAGYDWRQDCAFSAQTYLAPIIEEAMAECGGEKVILVAHSLGGLVCRSYCQRGGAPNVRALMLLGSPSLGAVQPYARLKRGVSMDDGGIMMVLRTMLLLFQEGSRDLLRLFPSMYQLLPNRVQCEANPDWLSVDEKETGATAAPFDAPLLAYPDQGDDPQWEPPPGFDGKFKNAAPGYDVYRDLFAGFLEVADNRALYSTYIDWAEAFHESLTIDGKAYMPDPTYCIACLDRPTPEFASLAKYGEIVARGDQNEYQGGLAPVVLRNGAGDEAVNAISCHPDTSLMVRKFADEYIVYGITHGSIPAKQEPIQKVVEWIDELMTAETTG